MAYPLMVLILAVLVSGSAAFSAYGENPRHPLVDQSSQRAAFAFTIATAAYLATLALFVYGLTVLSYVLGFVGLTCCAVGYVAARA